MTTLTALVYLTVRAGGYISGGNWALVVISAVMFLLGLMVAKEGFQKMIMHKRR